MGELAPEFFDCPDFCGLADPGKQNRSRACDECPRVELKNQFRDDCVEALDERAPGWGKKWTFDELFDQALDVFDFEQIDPGARTVTAEALVNILQSEREKMRRVDEFNRKAKAD